MYVRQKDGVEIRDLTRDLFELELVSVSEVAK